MQLFLHYCLPCWILLIIHTIPGRNQNIRINHALSRKQQYNFPTIHSWFALEQDFQERQMLCPGASMLLVKAGNPLHSNHQRQSAVLHSWCSTVNSWYMKHFATGPKECFISKNMKNMISFRQAQGFFSIFAYCFECILWAVIRHYCWRQYKDCSRISIS